MDVLARLRSLIALATAEDHSTSQAQANGCRNERATAALIACRIIKDHDMLSRATGPSAKKDTRNAPRTPPTPPAKVRTIRSKFAGTCRYCGAWFPVGARVAWRKDVGVAIVSHEKCVNALREA